MDDAKRRAATAEAQDGPSNTGSAIRVLTADDHPIVRRGIALLLSTEPDLQLVAEAANGHEAIQQFRAHRPDVTLMDLQMREMSGVDAISAIRGEFPDARIIVLTTYAGDVQARRAMQAGARAYMLKDSVERELLETIRAVHAGKRFVSPEVSYELAEHVAEDMLTATEVRVLQLIAQGKPNKEIARIMSSTETTVKWQVRTILSKLGAQDRTQAAMMGLRRGIIT
ncbi:MAG TPA: response regulator transcription factor [Steroidobacteraceae bacterium]|nr:response regulator transcription factor [Steroidobacteraceae bacterium]